MMLLCTDNNSLKRFILINHQYVKYKRMKKLSNANGPNEISGESSSNVFQSEGVCHTNEKR